MKYLLFALLIFFTSCTSSDKEITSFAVVCGPDTIKMEVGDSTIEGITNNSAMLDSVVAIFDFKGAKVFMDTSQQFSGGTANDFNLPLNYVVWAEDDSYKEYKVILRAFTGLPIIDITSPPIISKDVYVKGSMLVEVNKLYEYESEWDGLLYYKSIEIKGRGNSTWAQPKKPYKIKLDIKNPVLRMPADKEWGLLANYLDKSIVRNDILFELSERLEMKYTPRRQFVELLLNQEYQGNYLLTELVKLSKDRVNSNYVWEANARHDEKVNWQTSAGLWFSMKDPDETKPVVLDSIKKVVQDFENHVENYPPFENKDALKFIDTTSWVKWLIINEVMRNKDAVLYGSSFFYFDENKKIAMGPVWDADLSSGAFTESQPEGWYVISMRPWFANLMSNPEFYACFKRTWNEYHKKILSIIDYIDKQEQYLKYSQVRNFARWDVMNTVLYEHQVINGSYEAELSYLKAWLKTRIEWIDKELNK